MYQILHESTKIHKIIPFVIVSGRVIHGFFNHLSEEMVGYKHSKLFVDGFSWMCDRFLGRVLWLVNLPPPTNPPGNTGLLAGLVKGNQWFISPDHKAGYFRGALT